MSSILKKWRIVALGSVVFVYAVFAAVFHLQNQGKPRKIDILDTYSLRAAFFRYNDVGFQETFWTGNEFYVRGVVQKKGIGGGGIELKGADFAVFYPSFENVKTFETLRHGEDVIVQCTFKSISNKVMLFENCRRWP